MNALLIPANDMAKRGGTPTATAEILKQRVRQGGQLLNHGGEFGAIMNMLKDCAAAFESSEREST